jgi:hypothetical protein
MNKLRIPDEIEVIFVDDFSLPPLTISVEPEFNLKLIRHADARPWTIAGAFNLGAETAKGQYMIFMGIDHMLSKPAIQFALDSVEEYAIVPKKYALLNDGGVLQRISGGYSPSAKWWISRNLFDKLNGFDAKKYVGRGGEDLDILRRSRLNRNQVVADTFIYALPYPPDPRRPNDILYDSVLHWSNIHGNRKVGYQYINMTAKERKKKYGEAYA